MCKHRTIELLLAITTSLNFVSFIMSMTIVSFMTYMMFVSFIISMKFMSLITSMHLHLYDFGLPICSSLGLYDIDVVCDFRAPCNVSII